MDEMTNQKIAPRGAVFVCKACGKRSYDLLGHQAISHGWDYSCALNAVLCDEDTVVVKDGKATSAQEWDSFKASSHKSIKDTDSDIQP